jgi:hypothetical protein
VVCLWSSLLVLVLLLRFFINLMCFVFPPFRYLSMKTMSVGMGLETRVHCLNGIICQTRIVTIIMATFRVSLYSFGLN